MLHKCKKTADVKILNHFFKKIKIKFLKLKKYKKDIKTTVKIY